jgi:hypothetical protein
MDTPSFDLGIPPDVIKGKCCKRKLLFRSATDAALSLGFPEQPMRCSICSLVSPVHGDCFPVFDVSGEPVSSTPPYSFLPDTVDNDDVESAASAANDKWCQNRFNEFLVHINHVPLFPLMFMYL